ncbi:quinoprotein glucose dehydrogenase [Xanthomonas arboricola]|nr:glucose dehydrogenase [Xanthomonas euroxanthea]NIK40481.1 quinoprotein glucose dehydrogenase [Xanthomonas euroxanthea]
MADTSRAHRGGGWRIATILLSLFVAAFGLPLAGGGAWLIALGGSWYYCLVGIALVIAAVLIWKQRMAALHLFAGIWLATLLWSLWEVGLDGWALVPRLVGISVLLILTLLLTPVLRRRVNV